jgi:preprotein translocase subunit SecB
MELVYGGMFGLINIPPDSLQALLLIECPRLLFPFARRIIADTTRDGGFPPLMLDPIDFMTLYRRRQQAEAQAQAKGEGRPVPNPIVGDGPDS